MDEPIVLPEADDALATELNNRIDEFNARASGIDDGRLLQAELRDDEGPLVAGLTGWTWGGCGYIDVALGPRGPTRTGARPEAPRRRRNPMLNASETSSVRARKNAAQA